MSRSRRTKAEPQQATPAKDRARTPSGRRPSLRTAAGVRDLQRTIGNRAVSRLVTGELLQTKLSVGPAGDSYEREADQVADEVMRNLSPVMAPDDTLAPVRRRPVATSPVGLEGGPLGADTEAEIGRHRGHGAPLPKPLQQSMGQSFGADFGGVRVHTGPAADELSSSMQAKAFTVGRDIFLGHGQHKPETTSGQKLLAHELTHTL